MQYNALFQIWRIDEAFELLALKEGIFSDGSEWKCVLPTLNG